MARAHLMNHHRQFTNGEAVIEVEGATVGAVIESLDRRYPGLGEALTVGAAAGINGEIHNDPQFVAVEADTDIYFVAPLAGG